MTARNVTKGLSAEARTRPLGMSMPARIIFGVMAVAVAVFSLFWLPFLDRGDPQSYFFWLPSGVFFCGSVITLLQLLMPKEWRHPAGRTVRSGVYLVMCGLILGGTPLAIQHSVAAAYGYTVAMVILTIGLLMIVVRPKATG